MRVILPLCLSLFAFFSTNANALEITGFRQTPLLADSADGFQNLVKVQTKNTDQPITATLTLTTPSHTVTTETVIAAGESTLDLLILSPTSATTATISITPGAASPTSKDFPLAPVKQWKIYAVPSTHTDIGYTEGRADVLKRHNNSLDQALNYINTDPAAKWNLEVSWEFQNYMNLKSTTETQAMIEMMRTNRMGNHAGYLNMLTTLMSDEAMNRYCLYTAELNRTYGLKADTLILTDVPSATWSVPSTLAASGVRYFAEGCNIDRGPMARNSGINNPFYWQGPDGAKVLTVISMGYAQSAWLAEIDNYTNFQEHLTKVVQPYMRDDYPSDAIYSYGAFLDNRPFNPAYGRFLKQHAEQWAYPKILIATSDEFFHYVEAHSGDKLETLSGDFGAFWEDGAGSTALETSMHLESQRRLVAAETLFSLAAMAGNAAEIPTDRLTRTWEDVLFYIEHTWGAAESITQPDSPNAIQQWTEKQEFAHRPFADSKLLLGEAIAQYANQPASSDNQITVINPLGFARGGMVALDKNVQVAAEDGTVLPAQIKDGAMHVHIPNVSGFAHSTLSPQTVPYVAATSASLILENVHYKITSEKTKGVISIIDRESGKELIDGKGPYGFGQMVYALGGEGTRMVNEHSPDAPKFLLQPPLNGSAAPTPVIGEVFVYPANITSVEPGTSGPLFSEIAIRSTAPSMPQVLSTLRLYHHEKRIELDVDITSKTEERRKEAVYIAFPFAASDPQFHFGTTNAIPNPAKDYIKGGCHEWYCVQDFVACRSGDALEILWSPTDSPLITISELNKGTWKQSPELTTSTIFSYAMNNYWHTNYKAGQGGDFKFRYNFTSSAKGFTNSECLRFARSTGTPLLVASSGAGVAASSPLIEITGDTIIPNTIRKAANGKGHILRLRNPDNKPATTSIMRDGKPLQYQQVDLVENDLKPPAPISAEPLTIKPHQTVTLFLAE